MHFRRHISAEFLKLLQPSGPLAFMADFVKERSLPQYPCLWLDMQLRNEEGHGHVTIYAGMAAVLEIEHLQDDALAFRAVSGRHHKDTHALLRRRFPLAELPADLAQRVWDQLTELRLPAHHIEDADLFTSDLVRHFSIESHASDEFVIIAREPHPTGPLSARLSHSLMHQYRDLMAILAIRRRQDHFHPATTVFRIKSADSLGIGRDNALYVIKIAHSAHPAEAFCWSPYQIAIHHSFWSRCAGKFVADINSLIEQKESLGLIHQRAAGRRLHAQGLKIIPTLIVDGMLHHSHERYRDIRDHLKRSMLLDKDIPLSGLQEFRATLKHGKELVPLHW